jgi:Icc-related predicted phosphoesterase
MAHGKNGKDTLRIAALADLHYSRASQGTLQSLFAQISQSADVLLICGDLTDLGLPEEAEILARDITSALKIPVLAVLGNHDHEGGKADAVQDVMRDAGVHILDGDTYEMDGVGFAGVKGFGGGFGQHMLAPWGEGAVKTFVSEAVDEALKLESALSRLHTERRIALLHYSPVRDTVEGESAEIFPFAGCSRFEEPLNRYSVFAAFHGHAHRGVPEGRTTANVRVFNVSLPVLRRVHGDRPFCLLEVEANEQL